MILQPGNDTDVRPTWVYYLLCEHEGLLYVGIAYDLDRRLAQHRATKTWWGEVYAVSAIQLPSRRHALAAEADAIRKQFPRYNIQGSARPPSPEKSRRATRRDFLIGPEGRLQEQWCW